MIVPLLFCAVLAIFVFKYVYGGSGPNPFEKDTREPLKKMVHDKKEKNKVLKQGKSNTPAARQMFQTLAGFSCYKWTIKRISEMV